jgi:prepilin-type processing-associated H-X9-DG protein
LGSNDPVNFPSEPTTRHYEGSWMGIGAGGTVAGLPAVKEPPWYCFGSRHAAVVQFAFADGSVRGVRRGATADIATPSADWFLLQQIAGYKDGFNADTAAIVD